VLDAQRLRSGERDAPLVDAASVDEPALLDHEREPYRSIAPKGTLLARHTGMSDVELSESPSIDAELLLQKLRSGCNLLIVDVRSTAELVGGHIPGSRLIPIYQLVARASEIATHRTEPVVLVSRGGTRAKIAAGALRLAGFDEIFVLEGGIRRWRELDYPIERTATLTCEGDAQSLR
jgi:rhodanese-related sulfurtransferase